MTIPAPKVAQQAYTNQPLSIKSWAEEDRPREKLMLKGQHSLTDAELLAILLGSGSRHETAVDLAKHILAGSGNDLRELGKRTLGELQKFKGVGEAKAITILAAMELGRRRQLTSIRDRPVIRSSRDSYDLIAPTIADLPHEEFWIILINQSNKVLERRQVSSGGISATIVDPKLLFRHALEGRACGIILCHNHPSGSLQPSGADVKLTKHLVEAGKLLEIQVLDHLIISERGYYSFCDEGLM